MSDIFFCCCMIITIIWAIYIKVKFTAKLKSSKNENNTQIVAEPYKDFIELVGKHNKVLSINENLKKELKIKTEENERLKKQIDDSILVEPIFCSDSFSANDARKTLELSVLKSQKEAKEKSKSLIEEIAPALFSFIEKQSKDLQCRARFYDFIRFEYNSHFFPKNSGKTLAYTFKKDIDDFLLQRGFEIDNYRGIDSENDEFPDIDFYDFVIMW